MHIHDPVMITRQIGRWPAGTAGTIVDLDSAGREALVEIVGPDGRAVALLVDVAAADLAALPNAHSAYYATV